MKVDLKQVAQDAANPKRKAVFLPLVPDTSEDNVLDKSNSVTYELRTIPGDNNSASYKRVLRILNGTEDIRTIIMWYKEITPLLTGLNVREYEPQCAIVRTLLKGNCLSNFNAQLEQKKIETMQAAAKQAYDAAANGNKQNQYDAVINAGPNNHGRPEHVLSAVQYVLKELMPRKILQRVKRYLRRECRKPKEMKIREYFQHLVNMNIKMLPCLPPFEVANRLSNDEILDILLFGTPKSWQKEMDRQSYDPMENDLKDVIEFMEGIEDAEDFDGTTVTNSKKDSSAKKPSASGKKSQKSDGKGSKYCLLHGNGNHTTDECHQLKAEAKRIKSNTGSKEGSKSSGEDWASKASSQKKSTAKELNALVKKQVHVALKTATEKKRKSTGLEDELNAIDLDGFNYEDMDDLKIESGDEISI